MKHTNYHQAERALRDRQLDELRAALRAHGGTCSFHDDNDEIHGPAVYDETRISTAVLDEDGKTIHVYIADGSLPKQQRLREEVEVLFGDLNPETLDELIEAIPETDEVKDVTITPSFR